VISTRSVWLLQAKCNFQTRCDFDTHKYDYDTYNCDFNTQSVMLRRMTLTKVITTLITFVRVKLTLRLEITLCVWQSHSACRNHTKRVEITPYVNKSHSCVLKSHFAFHYYTRACDYHTMHVNITLCM
jgi:hypothetical protein